MKSDTIESIKILISCFTIYLLYGGATRLGALLFVASIYRYETNRKQASFPYVLAYMIRNLFGPIYGYLEQIFEVKSLILFGSVLAVLSVGANFFAEDILTVTILWGVLFGFAFGLGTQYLPSLINAHFTTNRSKANGFTYSGACFGGIIFPPIIDACLDYYGLSGSFLVLAAILANLIPASFLLKKPERISSITTNNVDSVKNKVKEDCSTISPLSNPGEYVVQKMSTDKHIQVNRAKVEISYINLNKRNQGVTNRYFPSDTRNEKSRKIFKSKAPSIFTFENFKIFFNPSFLIMLIATSGTSFIITTIWTTILDFVRDKGVGANIEVYYVMILPFTDIFGRIGSGYVNDKKILPCYAITVICFVGTGSTLFILHLTTNYILLMLVVSILPLFYGALLILQIALIHEYIEPGKRAMAQVCRFLLSAPISMGMPHMIGHFRGDLGSYDGVIYILTAISLFCGVIVFFIPRLENRRQSRNLDNVA